MLRSKTGVMKINSQPGQISLSPIFTGAWGEVPYSSAAFLGWGTPGPPCSRAHILRRGVPRTQSLSKIFNRARQSIRKVGARRPKDLLPGQGDIRFPADRKSTRLNSSHDQISYAVFCLKKKNLSIHRFPCG